MLNSYVSKICRRIVGICWNLLPDGIWRSMIWRSTCTNSMQMLSEGTVKHELGAYEEMAHRQTAR